MGFSRISRNENGLFVDRINDTGRVTSTISYGMGGDYVDPIMYGGFNEPELPPEPVAPPPVVQGPVLPGQSVEQPTPLTSPLNLPLTPPVNIPSTPADPEEDPEAFAGPGTVTPVSNVPFVPSGGGYHAPVDDVGLTMDPEMIGVSDGGTDVAGEIKRSESKYWTDSTTGLTYEYHEEKDVKKFWFDSTEYIFHAPAGKEAWQNRIDIINKAHFKTAAGDLEKIRLERELEDGETLFSIRHQKLFELRDDSDVAQALLSTHTNQALAKIIDAMVLPSDDLSEEDWDKVKNIAATALSYIAFPKKQLTRPQFDDWDFDKLRNRIISKLGSSDNPWEWIDTNYKLSPFWTKEVVSTSFPPDLAEDPRPDSDFTPSSYSSVPWSPIYQDFLNDKFGAAGSPAVFKYHSDQGLSNDPLQRTTYTQFLTQATEDDPWGGKLEGGHVIGAEPQGGIVFGPQSNIYDQNRYNNFLQTYVPLTGDSLTGRIDEIINVIRQVDSDKPGGTWDRYDPVGVDQDYSSEQLQAYRWRHSFFEGPGSVVNQKALAALPIMQNTHPTLRNETSKILHRLHNDWLTTPDKDPTVGWLEYVHENDYFGMIPEKQKEETYVPGM